MGSEDHEEWVQSFIPFVVLSSAYIGTARRGPLSYGGDTRNTMQSLVIVFVIVEDDRRSSTHGSLHIILYSKKNLSSATYFRAKHHRSHLYRVRHEGP